MIRSRAQLSRCLARGLTVVRDLPQPSSRQWILAGLGETVHTNAVRACLARGDAHVLSRDLLGDPDALAGHPPLKSRAPTAPEHSVRLAA